MGFFDVFKPKVKEYSLEEAIRLIEKDTHDIQAKDREESYQSALKTRWEMSQLASLIEEFSSKPIPEAARSSADVKRRFCSLARKQIEALGTPTRDNSEFLHNVRLTLDNLGGLTHRQLMHINFFFKEDFKPVAKKISEIHALLSSKSGASEQAKTLELYRKMSTLESKKRTLHDSILASERHLSQLHEHELPPLVKQPDPFALSRAELKLSSIKQEIDSFLAVQKVLKKYAYIENIRNPLLDSYIESPSTALMKDDNLSIIGHVSHASVLAKDGKIDGDKKLETIATSAGYLAGKREELLTCKSSVEAERASYRREQELFEESLKTRTNLLAEAEAAIKSVEKSTRAQKEEHEQTEKEIARLRVELCLLTSKLLDANVR